MLCRARPTWGLERLVVEQIRGRIALLDRRYCLRLALGEQRPQRRRGPRRVGAVRRSLPPPARGCGSRRQVLALVADRPGPAGVARAAARRTTDRSCPRRSSTSWSTVTSDLEPGDFTETLDTLHAHQPEGDRARARDAHVVGLFRVAADAAGVRRQADDLRHAGLDRWPGGELGASGWPGAKQLDVHRAEVELFAALGMRPPSADGAMDLWVKGAIVAILVALAVLALCRPPRCPGHRHAACSRSPPGGLAWLARRGASARCGATSSRRSCAEPGPTPTG